LINVSLLRIFLNNGLTGQTLQTTTKLFKVRVGSREQTVLASLPFLHSVVITLQRRETRQLPGQGRAIYRSALVHNGHLQQNFLSFNLSCVPLLDTFSFHSSISLPLVQEHLKNVNFVKLYIEKCALSCGCCIHEQMIPVHSKDKQGYMATCAQKGFLFYQIKKSIRTSSHLKNKIPSFFIRWLQK
jgi:hypothetical protein